MLKQDRDFEKILVGDTGTRLFDFGDGLRVRNAEVGAGESKVKGVTADGWEHVLN